MKVSFPLFSHFVLKTGIIWAHSTGTKELSGISITISVWIPLNEHILVTFDNGVIRLYDPQSGDEVEEVIAHDKKINRISFNLEKTLFITSSADFSAKLFDSVDMKHFKTYKTDRPVNDAVISETKDHILLGGGQEVMSVTTTSGKVGKFETRFFHLVYEEEFGTVKGHFGPINALAILASQTFFQVSASSVQGFLSDGGARPCFNKSKLYNACLLYTSDAADE